MTTTLLTSIMIALAPLATTPANAPAVDGLPACQYEDGNPDGRPCIWTDPDTGKLYYDDSANYR